MGRTQDFFFADAAGNGVTLHAGGITLNNNYIGLALDGSAAGNTGDGVFVAATSSGNNLGFNPDAATLAEELHEALAVVNPKQPGCEYPFKQLVGVGIAYKLVQALGAAVEAAVPGRSPWA